MTDTAPQSKAADPATLALPALTVLLSLILQNVGAAAAKSLFPLVGVEGMTALRVGLSAVVLVALWRPWRSRLSGPALRTLILYGATLGLMNLLIYKAFERIPLGVALAIEITGPLAVALAGSRRPRDVAWVACAVAGLALLLPLGEASAALDPVGLAFAAGAATCWAFYIVFGKRASMGNGGQAVALGMVVAALLTVPIGVATAGAALLQPQALLIGAVVAVLSSAAPYSLEMVALRRLPRPVFGILVASAPAIAALAGVVILGEHLTSGQWAAVALIITASAGSAWSRNGA